MHRGLLTVALALSVATARAQPELIERTLAIVAGQPITLTDVHAVTTLGLIDVSGADVVPLAAQRLIDRALVLREVQRYTPPEPTEAAVDGRAAAVRARFASDQAFKSALDAVGFSESQVRAWLREDLRIAAYIDQRFAAAGTPGDDEVSAEFVRQREEFEKSGLTFEQAAPKIRERLAAQRRIELTTDWIADLRRRTPVVELLKQ